MQNDRVVQFPGGDLAVLPAELIPSVPVDTPLLLERKRKRAERERRGTFALGPIDLAWAGACERAYPGALLLALGIRAYAKMRGSPTPVGNTLGAQLQLDPRKRRRALAGLEAAGLVLVERRPNRVPRATLVQWPPQTEPQSSAGHDS
jgi:hypothetical protein